MEWHTGEHPCTTVPFSDHLTTLMFIVASDLSEAQRERLTGSLSLQGLDVPAETFEAARTVLWKLFFSPKRSVENPSLRVSGHGGSTNRTFIMEDNVLKTTLDNGPQMK